MRNSLYWTQTTGNVINLIAWYSTDSHPSKNTNQTKWCLILLCFINLQCSESHNGANGVYKKYLVFCFIVLLFFFGNISWANVLCRRHKIKPTGVNYVNGLKNIFQVHGAWCDCYPWWSVAIWIHIHWNVCITYFNIVCILNSIIFLDVMKHCLQR